MISFNTILCVRCFTCPIKKYARAGLCPWKLSSGRNSRCHKTRTQKKKKKRFTAYLFIFSDRKEKEKKKKKEKKHATNYELFSCQRDVGELFDHPCGVSDNHPGSCPPHQPAGGLPEQRSPGGARVTALRFKSQQRRFCFCPADSSYNPN